MKGRPIDQVVYEHMFPKPKPTDPQNFQSFLQKNLITEVRQETQCFYGSLDSREAQYPGLDYAHQPHRMRLSRFTWHRRLFRAFDALGITNSEIAGLTKWEGTRWAKERFEKEQGIKIRDTTGDCIYDWVDPKLRQPVRALSQSQEAEVEEMECVEEDGDTEDMDEDVDESDMEVESVGFELNERLRAAAAARAAGGDSIMDAEWEQWLKDAAEAGGLSEVPGNLQEAVRQRITNYMRAEEEISTGQRRTAQDLLSMILPTASPNAQSQRQPTSPTAVPHRSGLLSSTFALLNNSRGGLHRSDSTQSPRS